MFWSRYCHSGFSVMRALAQKARETQRAWWQSHTMHLHLVAEAEHVCEAEERRVEVALHEQLADKAVGDESAGCKPGREFEPERVAPALVNLPH